MYLQMGGAKERITVMPLGVHEAQSDADAQAHVLSRLSRLDAGRAHAYKVADRQCLWATIEASFVFVLVPVGSPLAFATA